MTETQIKLHDADTQMKLALYNASNEEIVRSCINSFISLARSVTFVMQKESAIHPELTSWYNDKMSNLKHNPLMKFFHNKRTQTIHNGTIKPYSRTEKFTNLIVKGKPIIREGFFKIWLFDDVDEYLPGDKGGVFRLCKSYFLILETLVYEWLEIKKRIELKRI